MNNLDVLWQPIDIAGITLRNRIIVSAHDAGFSKDNILSDRYVAYLEDRAKGGAALVMPGAQVVHKSSSGGYPIVSQGWRPEAVPQYRKLADAVHRHGARVFVQMVHWGAQDIGSIFLDQSHELLAPSDVRSVVFGEEPRPMEQEDIDEVIEGYAQTAVNAKEAGIDGVEVHGGHGYLVCQFFSPLTNKRTDQYGGSTENRCRFALEIAKRVRERCGEDFPVGIRVSFDELMEGGGGGLTADEGERIVRRLHDSKLFSYFNITGGNDQSQHRFIAPMTSGYHGNLVPFAARVKAFSQVPVVTVGRITNIHDAAEIVSRGDADIVAMTRGHIADPEIVNKAQSGRADEIRACIGINQGCLNRISHGFEISCTQNATVGREQEWGIGSLTTVSNPKRVVVVGGGPAGLKAAEIAARRGHQVTLFERAHELGGQVRFAARLPLRDEWAIMIRTLERSMNTYGVNVRCGVDASAETIAAEMPDEVIVATGSLFATSGYTPAQGDRAGIPGTFTPVDPIAAIDNPDVCGDRVLIVDDKGDYLPLGLAHLLAQTGRSVEIVSRHMFVGGGVSFTGDLPWVYPQLAKLGVILTPQTLVDSLAHDNAVLTNIWTGNRETRAVDSVIFCMGKVPVNELYRELRTENGVPVHRVGDCVAPRNVDEAIYDGERVARAL